MNIKVECHEANHLCDKNQYQEATFWEKIKLNIHLIYCRMCREYTKRNIKLTKRVKDPRVKAISSSDRSMLKERLRQEMSE